MHLHYPAKSGQVRDAVVEDDEVADAGADAARRRDDGAELLAWQDDAGWHDVTSADVGAYVKAAARRRRHPEGLPHVARDGARRAGRWPTSGPRRGRSVRVARGRPEVVRDVAEELGNTPAVCRASYIDPRVIDLWERGTTIRPTRSQAVAERETLALLSER